MAHTYGPNNGYNVFVCKRCGLDDYQAEGVECPGRRAYACPTQSNGLTHGACLQVFGSQTEAQAHYLAEHR